MRAFNVTILAAVLAATLAIPVTALAATNDSGVRADASSTTDRPHDVARPHDHVQPTDRPDDVVRPHDHVRPHVRPTDRPDDVVRPHDHIGNWLRRCYNWVVEHTDIRPRDDVGFWWRLCHRLVWNEVHGS